MLAMILTFISCSCWTVLPGGTGGGILCPGQEDSYVPASGKWPSCFLICPGMGMRLDKCLY